MEVPAVDKRLLDILCCPVTREPLRLLTRSELDSLNQAFTGGAVCSVDGSAWTTPVAAALLTRDGTRIYRIEDDIPVMLPELALETRGLAGLSPSR